LCRIDATFVPPPHPYDRVRARVNLRRNAASRPAARKAASIACQTARRQDNYRNVAAPERNKQGRKTSMITFASAAAVAMAALAGARATHGFALTSPDVKAGARIPDRHAYDQFGCPGENLSPALSWSGAPEGATSFAVTLFDPDAPARGGFWHWLMFDIPAGVTSLPRGAGDPSGHKAPKGATQTVNDFGAPGYGGPCPPKGARPHRYQFTLYALDVARLDLDARATPDEVEAELTAHTLAKATLTGLWGR
jgi:Raf kinase inhibitor-like YbhB/YbcL family protein